MPGMRSADTPGVVTAEMPASSPGRVRRDPRRSPRHGLPTLLLWLLLALVGGLAGGCGQDSPQAEPTESTRESPAGAVADTGAQTEEVADAARIVFLGDSLTAGFGLAEEQAFPAVVEERLRRRGFAVRVVNAGVSGDTSAGGLARLDWVLRQEPDLLVVGLGANDGLRGLSTEATEANLRRIVAGAREAGVRVVLLGMKLPPNYGPRYTARFQALYPRIAKDLDVPLVPFLLEGVGGEPELNLPDGIHPNAEGHRRVAANVVPVVAEVLRTPAAKPAAKGARER